MHASGLARLTGSPSAAWAGALSVCDIAGGLAVVVPTVALAGGASRDLPGGCGVDPLPIGADRACRQLAVCAGDAPDGISAIDGGKKGARALDRQADRPAAGPITMNEAGDNILRLACLLLSNGT